MLRKFLLVVALTLASALGLAGTGVAEARGCSFTGVGAPNYISGPTTPGQWQNNNSYENIFCTERFAYVETIDQLNIGGFDPNVYYANSSASWTYVFGSDNKASAYLPPTYWPVGCPGNSSTGGAWVGTYWWSHRRIVRVRWASDYTYQQFVSAPSSGIPLACA